MNKQPCEKPGRIKKQKPVLLPYLSLMPRLILFIFCANLLCTAFAQPKTDSALLSILATNNDSVLRDVLQHPDAYRLQIIYTQINRDGHNKPSFVNYYFHYDPDLYFNPASMVKMPLAFLALEKLNELNKKGVNKYTTIQFDSAQPWQKPLYRDTSAANEKPTIAHFIKRAFLISENDPYNRLYQFVTPQEVNRNLHQKGYPDVRITRQFMGLDLEKNRYTNPIRFLAEKGEMIYSQPAAYNKDSFYFPREVKLGKAYLNRNDSLVNEPFDFTWHNNLSLGTMRQLLQSVLFPDSVPEAQRFKLSKEDYRFLYQYLSQFPSETPDPKYDTAEFYDSYVKFFFLNSTHHLPDGVRVFNKVGWAYGFQTDVSYVADFKNGVEFMLAATIYVNKDEILNDNAYEYNTTGLPFLYQLGQTIYQYELGRERKHKPDLSAFRIQYEHRDPADKRPSLKEVDN